MSRHDKRTLEGLFLIAISVSISWLIASKLTQNACCCEPTQEKKRNVWIVNIYERPENHE